MALTLPKSYAQDVTQPIKVRNGGELVFTGNSDVDTISVALYNGGAEYEPGGTVALNCIRADGVTMVVSGAVSGNVASATLTQACCAVPGMMTVVMQLTSGGTGAIFAAVYNVLPSSTETVGDAGTIIEDAAALIADIDAAVATIPTNYSALLASIAPTYSATASYRPFDYVWYNGALYRCLITIDGGETWNSKHWYPATIGDDIAALMTATRPIRTATAHAFEAGSITLSGYNAGDVVDTTINTGSSYKHVIFQVQRGDLVELSVSGGAAPRAWAITDADYKLVAVSASNSTLSGAWFIAPCDGWFIANSIGSAATCASYTLGDAAQLAMFDAQQLTMIQPITLSTMAEEGETE